MSLDDIRTYPARLFLGRTCVRAFHLGERRVRLRTLERSLHVHPLRPSARVLGRTLYESGMKVVVSGKAFSDGNIADRLPVRRLSCVFLQPMPAKGGKISRTTVSFTKKISLIRGTVREGRRMILSLPQERANRLFWLRARPSFPKGEIPLAFFSPVLPGGMIKSILNKEKGTLLLWYNPYSRSFSARGLLLIRHLGQRDGLEWKWID